MNDAFVSKCHRAVTVFLIVRPITTVVTVMTAATGTSIDGCHVIMFHTCSGHYVQGDFSSKSAFTYITIANSAALGTCIGSNRTEMMRAFAVWAMYGLILFYLAFRLDMAATSPLKKASHTLILHVMLC